MGKKRVEGGRKTRRKGGRKGEKKRRHRSREKARRGKGRGRSGLGENREGRVRKGEGEERRESWKGCTLPVPFWSMICSPEPISEKAQALEMLEMEPAQGHELWILSLLCSPN